MTSVTFSRALIGAGLADLTIPAAPGGPYWLDEDITIPELEHRISYADESRHVAGALATQSVLALGTLAFKVYTEAADVATLKTQMSDLRAVLSQFTYTATLDLIGTDTYTCLPGRLSWGQIDSGLVRRLIVPGVVTIPVQPLEA